MGYCKSVSYDVSCVFFEKLNLILNTLKCFFYVKKNDKLVKKISVLNSLIVNYNKS
jgi:hypothetical protein